MPEVHAGQQWAQLKQSNKHHTHLTRLDSSETDQVYRGVSRKRIIYEISIEERTW